MYTRHDTRYNEKHINNHSVCYSAAGASQQQLAMPTLPHFSLACLSLADALLLRRLKLQIPHRWQGWPESSAIVWAVMDDASFTMLASSSYTPWSWRMMEVKNEPSLSTQQLIIITRRVVHHENQSIMAYIICLHQKIRQLTWSHFKMYLSYYILPVKLIVSYDFFFILCKILST